MTLCLNMMSKSNTRWCPTPEQVMVLEELYRRGLRTPNASQIQKITAHLSLYGTIQGKNVFYWFQNHKARDRQKLRNKLAKQLLHHPLLHFHIPSIPSAGNSTPFQGNGAWEKAPDDVGVMRTSDPPKEMLMYGHDSTVVGPTFPPLQTLQLFPLTSSANHQEETQTPTSSFLLNN